LPNPEDIASQLELLAAHRFTLAEYLKQQALLGVAYAPPGIANGIRASRSAIRQTKATLREWGAECEDLPDDEPSSLPTPQFGSEQAGVGLIAMAGLMSAPDIRKIVEGFQDSFGIICQQIDRLSSYKDLHDLLHDLQFNCYNPMMRGAKDFPNNALFLESLEDYAIELQQIINSLWEVAERAAFSTSERAWISQFSPTIELLHSAIDHSNPEMLNRVLIQIGRVLYVHPTRINERLKETARSMPLPRLISAMSSVREYPAGADLDTEKLRQVGQGVEALELLSRNLVQLLDQHDTWQEIELELHRIEEDFERHAQELEWLWPDLKSRLLPLGAGQHDRWSQELQQACANLDRTLEIHAPTAVAASFRRFRRQAGLCFFQADKRLKELCRKLRDIDGPLNSIMGLLG